MEFEQLISRVALALGIGLLIGWSAAGVRVRLSQAAALLGSGLLPFLVFLGEC